MRDKILRGGLAVVLRQFLSLPANALGVIAASRLLQPSDYGVQAVILPVVAFGMLIADLGTSQALIQSKFYLSTTLARRLQLLRAACAVGAVVLLAVMAPWLLRTFGLVGVTPLLFPACGLLGWLQSQRSYRSTILQRAVEWQTLARVEMIEIVVYNVVLVATAYLLRSAWCFVIALAVRHSIGAILLRITTRTVVTMEPEAGTSIAALLRFGIPWQITIMFSLLLNSANPLIVGNLLGLSAVGIINWSSTLVSLPQLPFQPLPNFLFSVLSARKRQDKDDSAIAADIAYGGMVLICSGSLAVALVLDLLVRHLLGNQWSSAVPVASILLLSNAAFCPSLILAAQLNSSGHSQAYLLLTILKTILTWSLIAAGVAVLHIQGYAVAWVAVALLILVAESLTTRRLTGTYLRWSDSIFLTILMVLAMLIGQAARGSVHGSQLSQSVISLLVGMAAFGAMLWLTSQRRLRHIYALGGTLLPGSFANSRWFLPRGYGGES